MNKTRLTKTEVNAITSTFKKLFLAEDELWLFGSRANMSAKGGDIDLYVETKISDLQTIVNIRSRFSADIKEKIGDQKIDIVINYNGSEELPIYKYAKEEGVKLI